MELEKQATQLAAEVKAAMSRLDIAAGQKDLAKLKEQAAGADFWTDNLNAQANMKQQAKLEGKIQPWSDLRQELDETSELLAMDDPKLETELKDRLDNLEIRFNDLKERLKFSGPYDDHDAIVSIHAGAGGTDAQDWAQMLMRMYLRFAESHKLQAKVIDESAGEEAGIKSVTFEISGEFVYGQLKGEHGVHRLVRLSPFNADHLRQTSFAKVEVMPKVERPEEVELDDKELRIDIYRSGGHGGQSVNTTDSAVRITHLPTGITVAIQNERSQLQNKETAMTVLRSRIAQLQIEQHKDHLSELKGPNQSADWGNQIRSYVLHPYKQVKDLRTKHETSDPDKVLDGQLDEFIAAFLDNSLAA